MNPDTTYPKHLIGHFLGLDEIWHAAGAALETPLDDASDVILKAAGAMPAEASDFDRGIAAGLALARYLDRWSTKSSSPDNCTTDN